MFPLNSNMPYIKDNGERDKLGNVVGSGGGSELPAHTVADAGKVLTVGSDNKLVWNTVSGSSSFVRVASPLSSVRVYLKGDFSPLTVTEAVAKATGSLVLSSVRWSLTE